ncbi:hexose transporter [Pluteus cervinus]|uniref:Hexose transporter n=2 Tax=Pluteus cervinus TaxID=181527 RepID=A0ACD3ADW1_9AGAR|nr:hexose transporter [Pluteus cervinus]TFK63499.1 hexose transporter [Pluteus cervinus]
MAPNNIVSDGQKSYMHLVDTSRPWYKNRRIVVLNLWIMLLSVTSMANGYDDGLQLLKQWELDFNNPSGSKLGLLGAIQNIGGLAAFPFSPYMADILGRKRTVFFGSVVMVLATIVQTASQNVNMFIGARFMLGFGLGFAANTAPMLIMEIAYPTQRGPISSVYNALWPGGALLASWVTFGSFHMNSSWAWRMPSAFQALPSVFQVFLILWGPESPRWLVARGREKEALEVLGYYHGNGNQDDPLVQFEFEEIRTAIHEEQIQARTSWFDLFRTPGNRKRMRIVLAIAVFSQWSDLNKVFDTIGITDPVEQLLINAFLNLWSLILAVGGGLLCDRLGRRTLFITSTAGMLVFFLLQTVCSSQYALHGNKAAGNAVVAFIYLYSAAYAIAYSPLITSYTIEVLPFSLRAKGFTLFGFFVTASLVFNQYVNPIALQKLGWKYYIVYVVWLAFELVYVYLFLVERTLEETAALFDGDTKVAELQRHAAATVGLSGAESHGSTEKVDEKKSESVEGPIVRELEKA